MKSFSLWRPHPWHGLDVGAEPPRRVHAYIEISPFDISYKLAPGHPQHVSIGEPYGFEHATKVIEAAMAGYLDEFGANLETT